MKSVFKEDIQVEAMAYAESFRLIPETTGWYEQKVRDFTAGYEAALKKLGVKLKEDDPNTNSKFKGLEQVCEIIMIPSDKETSLGIQANGVVKYLNGMGINALGIGKFQHLHLTCNDEIESGDWCYWPNTNSVKQCVNPISEMEKQLGIKKIIASTDDSLKIPKKQDDGKTWWASIPKISESFVKHFADTQAKIKNVIVEYEEDYSEVDEDQGSLWRAYINYVLKILPNNEVIIKF